MAEAQQAHVTILGEKRAVFMPDFAAREELMVAYGEALKKQGVAKLRVYAATLGLCTMLGRKAGADYARARFDVLAYGGEVYSWLRGQGATVEQIAEAAIPVLTEVSQALYPSETEVRAEVGNSEGGAAG